MIIGGVTISPKNSAAQIIVKAGIKKVTVRTFVGPISAINQQYSKDATPLLNSANKIIFTVMKGVSGPGDGDSGTNGSKIKPATNWLPHAIARGFAAAAYFLV